MYPGKLFIVVLEKGLGPLELVDLYKEEKYRSIHSPKYRKTNYQLSQQVKYLEARLDSKLRR